MINHIELKNFKAFKEASVDLSNLNLFTGINGVGKSSFIQALLMLRQSHLDKQLPKQIVLNHNKYVRLGKSQDIFNMYTNEDDVLSIRIQTTLIGAIFTEVRAFQDKTFLEVTDYSPAHWSTVEKEPMFNQRFQYLYAEREAPRGNFPIDQYEVEVLQNLGNKGQHTVHFIANHQAKKVELPSLIDPNGFHYENTSSDDADRDLNNPQNGIPKSMQMKLKERMKDL